MKGKPHSSLKKTHVFSMCDVQNTMLGIIAIRKNIYLVPQVSEKLKTPRFQ